MDNSTLVVEKLENFVSGNCLREAFKFGSIWDILACLLFLIVFLLLFALLRIHREVDICARNRRNQRDIYQLREDWFRYTDEEENSIKDPPKLDPSKTRLFFKKSIAENARTSNRANINKESRNEEILLGGVSGRQNP